MSVTSPLPRLGREFTKIFTFDCNRAGGTYDIATAAGDLMIVKAVFYMVTAAGGLTSVAVATNSTTAQTYLSSGEGAVANLTADKTVPNSNNNVATMLKSGNKLRGTINGTGNAGSMLCIITFIPLSEASDLS